MKKRSGNKATVHRGMADAAAFVCVEQFRGLVQASRERSKHTARRALPIYDKTLVAWVSLDNIQQRGVGILSLVNIPVPQFDGIVFSEFALLNGCLAADIGTGRRRTSLPIPRDRSAG